MSELYIGLMSGTSVDGIDAALVDLQNSKPKLLATHAHDIPPAIQSAAKALAVPQENEIHKMYEVDHQLGHLFAEAALALLQKANLSATEVRAIGSHGQTIRHQPNHHYPYAIQIGDPNIIAARTGITTIADFRRRDIANGGQGAPFAPVFHAHVLADKSENRAVVNIGGIANITLLAAGQKSPLMGYDTGPGNGLLDSFAVLHLHKSYDNNGEWAASGHVNAELLAALLAHPYFAQQPPKSTGRDHFHLSWLNSVLPKDILPADVQRTLLELTAVSIADAMRKAPLKVGRVLLCGGGAHNRFLVERIRVLLEPIPVNSTEDYGVSVDYLEAMLFAWLAQQTLNHKEVDLMSVTGAKKPSILGGIYL